MVEKSIEQHQSRHTVRSRLNCTLKNGFKLRPIIKIHNGYRHSDENSNAFLDSQLRFLNILPQKHIPKLFFLIFREIFVLIDEIALEEDCAHLPDWPFFATSQ